MSFYIQNTLPVGEAGVAMVRYDPTLPNQWRKSGWFIIPGGATATLYSGTLQDPNLSMFWYFYVNSFDEAGAVWSGPLNIAVPENGFSQCYQDNTGCDMTVGFLEINVNGYTDFTLQLT